MAEDSRCQQCGNAGRFTVVVQNDRVSGLWCRNACSRLCADMLEKKGRAELWAIAGYAGNITSEVRPQLSKVG